MRICSSPALEISPVKTLRTVPAVLRHAAGVADAHAAAVLGRESGVLGLLEQRQAAVGDLAPAGGEADEALGAVGVEARARAA